MNETPLSGLSAIADDYDAVLCDVWGVLHNGVAPHHGAVDALTRLRGAGKAVLLITNAPRPASSVIAQLRDIGVPDGAFDAVVSSGDVVRQHMDAAGYRSVFHLGPARDHCLFEGTGVAFHPHIPKAGVDAIVATDLLRREETPDDYREKLAGLVPLGLPFVCANPDLVVERGGSIIYCGGSLARVYEEEGGTALQFGKPHLPIYDLARAKIAEIKPDAARILAIGDGLPTDIDGANRQGLDVLFVTNGIHVDELGEEDRPDPAKVAARLAAEGLAARDFMPRLSW
ncbi:MAG: TIGR01459 family HAD-type hydrolase [Pseudomonadota bacterium]